MPVQHRVCGCMHPYNACSACILLEQALKAPEAGQGCCTEVPQLVRLEVSQILRQQLVPSSHSPHHVVSILLTESDMTATDIYCQNALHHLSLLYNVWAFCSFSLFQLCPPVFLLCLL